MIMMFAVASLSRWLVLEEVRHTAHTIESAAWSNAWGSALDIQALWQSDVSHTVYCNRCKETTLDGNMLGHRDFKHRFIWEHWKHVVVGAQSETALSLLKYTQQV